MVTVATECCAFQRGSQGAVKKDAFLTFGQQQGRRRFKVSFEGETL